MNITGPAMQAAVLKVLLDEISGRLDVVKRQAEHAFTETGATQAVPELPDGTKIATVSLTGGGGQSAYVDSENDLMAWVLAEHPDQVELVIRDSYKKALLDHAKKAGQAIDPATGEKVPGIAVKPSKAYVSIRFKTGAKEAVAAAWRDGQLPGVEIVAPAAIEAAEEEAPVPTAAEYAAMCEALYRDEHGFLGPEAAAAHVYLVQGGFSTPPIEAYRMIRDGGVHAERALAWLSEVGLDAADPHEGKQTPWPLSAPEASDAA